MRAYWKGTLGVGLVNIPVGLYCVLDSADKLSTHFRRASDHSRVKYNRVAETTGDDVSPDEVIRCVEWQQREVLLTPDEWKTLQIDGPQVIDIKEFVDQADFESVFSGPKYYVAPERGSDSSFVVLREALNRTCKVGVGTVIIRKREHVAAVKACRKLLLLELLHYADELADPTPIEPDEHSIEPAQVDMAVSLIREMSGPWELSKYRDKRREALVRLLEQKLAHGQVAGHQATLKNGTTTFDLTAHLEASLNAIARKRKMGNAQ